MTAASIERTTLLRAAAAVGLVAVVGGLPIAVSYIRSPDGLAHISTANYTSGSVRISTPLRISERFPLTIDSGYATGIEGTRSGDRRDAQIAVDKAALTLDLSERNNLSPSGSNLFIANALPSGTPQIAGFSSGALRLTRASLTVIGPYRTGVEVKDVNATISVSRKGSYKLVGTGVVNGQTIAMDALWSDAGPRESVSQVPLRLNVRSPVLEAILDGLFRIGERPSFSGEAEFRLPSLGRFVSWLALGRGVSEHLRSIVVSGQLEWTPAQMSFTQANLGVNGHQSTGAITIKHAGSRLSIDGTLGFQELDLGRQLQGLIAGHQPQSADPHVLTVIDADLRLSAAKVQAPGVEMGRAAVSIALNKGRLQADIAELEIESGVAGGQLAVDLNEFAPKAALKLKLRGVDVGRVLAEPMRRNPILGKANLTFEGTLGGRTLDEGLASLAGRGHFELAESGRLGLDLSALIHAARATNVVGWAAAGRGGTSVDALTGRFRVLNGALTIETVQARSGTAILVGSGRLDVPARLMDMVVASAPGATSEAPLAAHEALLLRGTWDTPAISLQRQTKPDAKVEAPAGIH